MDIVTEWKDYHLTDLLQRLGVMGPHNRSQTDACEIPGGQFAFNDNMQVFYLTKWK